MIEILDREHFKAAVAFAKSQGAASWASLRDSLRYLSLYATHYGTDEAKPVRSIKCRLFRDFAPHSFEFDVIRDEKRWFNGGLICHPAHSNGMGELSVTLSPRSFTNWQVHT